MGSPFLLTTNFASVSKLDSLVTSSQNLQLRIFQYIIDKSDCIRGTKAKYHGFSLSDVIMIDVNLLKRRNV